VRRCVERCTAAEWSETPIEMVRGENRYPGDDFSYSALGVAWACVSKVRRCPRTLGDRAFLSAGVKHSVLACQGVGAKRQPVGIIVGAWSRLRVKMTVFINASGQGRGGSPADLAHMRGDITDRETDPGDSTDVRL